MHDDLRRAQRCRQLGALQRRAGSLGRAGQRVRAGGDQRAQVGTGRDRERPQVVAVGQHRDVGAARDPRRSDLHRTAPRAITGISASTTPPRAAYSRSCRLTQVQA